MHHLPTTLSALAVLVLVVTCATLGIAALVLFGLGAIVACTVDPALERSYRHWKRNRHR